MTTLNVSEARANLYRLIDQIAESHQPVVIAGKRSSAVLVSTEDWQAIQETLSLLAVPGMGKSIKKGMAEPLAKSARYTITSPRPAHSESRDRRHGCPARHRSASRT
jgi:prevent-host-death family protein